MECRWSLKLVHSETLFDCLHYVAQFIMNREHALGYKKSRFHVRRAEEEQLSMVEVLLYQVSNHLYLFRRLQISNGRSNLIFFAYQVESRWDRASRTGIMYTQMPNKLWHRSSRTRHRLVSNFRNVHCTRFE